MSCNKRIVSGLAALSLLAVSPAAMATVHFDRSVSQIMSVLHAPARHSPVVLAQDNEQQWHHDDDRGWYNHDWNVNQGDGGYRLGPNDYYWGGTNRYKNAPAWFNAPPEKWSRDRRRAYLEQRRQVAINMQQQMLARGDTRAAQRLSGVIDQLNHELRYR